MHTPRFGSRRLGAAIAALALLTGLAVTLPSSQAQAAGTVRIMPLGDSITGSPGCWRSVLWNRLQSSGYKNIDMVGSLNNNGSCGQSFDGDNEGHGGFLARDIVGNKDLPGWLNSAKPDIVMMGLGTNDVWNNIPTNTILGYYSTLVDQMRANNPKMHILVAQITPMAPTAAPCSTCAQGVSSLDNAIPSWASSKSTSASPITVVNQYTGYNDSTDTIDGVHPNASGNQKLSDHWYPALTAAITAVGSPTTTAPTTTTKPPTTTAPTTATSNPPTTGTSGGTTGGTGNTTIVGTQSDKCIDIPNSTTTNGTVSELWDCNGGANQNITVSTEKQLQVLGKCLDVTGQGTTAGTPVQLWDCNGQTNQIWTLNANGTITPGNSSLCLDATGQGASNGTQLQVWDCNGQTNQSWKTSVGSGGTTTTTTTSSTTTTSTTQPTSPTSTKTTSPSTGGSDKGLHVVGNQLQDGNGNKVVLRAVEDVIRWGDYTGKTPWGDVPWEGGTNDANGNQIAEIAKTGANTVRILGGDPSELEGILHKAIIEQHMWVSVDRADWRDPTTIKTLQKYAKYITLQPKGESLETDETSWKNDSIYVVQQMRKLGYTSPIEIYANGYGQTGQTVLDQGDAVFNADPLKDTVFGYQLYSEYANDVNGWLNKTANFDHPIFVGACLFPSTYGNTPNTYKQVWEGTASRGLSSFYWAWSGDGTGNNMSSNGSFSSLTAVGQYIVNGSSASLKKDSVKSAYLLNAHV